MARKRREYFEAGVRIVWQIDPKKRTVAVYRRRGAIDDAQTRSGTLDGGRDPARFRAPAGRAVRRAGPARGPDRGPEGARTDGFDQTARRRIPGVTACFLALGLAGPGRPGLGLARPTAEFLRPGADVHWLKITGGATPRASPAAGPGAGEGRGPPRGPSRDLVDTSGSVEALDAVNSGRGRRRAGPGGARLAGNGGTVRLVTSLHVEPLAAPGPPGDLHAAVVADLDALAGAVGQRQRERGRFAGVGAGGPRVRRPPRREIMRSGRSATSSSSTSSRATRPPTR